MALQYPENWRWEPPADGNFATSAIPTEALGDFEEIIQRIANQGNRWFVLEHFKRHFGSAYRSSSEDWAFSDLQSAMSGEAVNAPAFLEAFINGCNALRDDPAPYNPPTLDYINRILAKNNIGYEIRDGALTLREAGSTPIPVTINAPTIDEKSRAMFAAALNRSDELLQQGRSREAVQEILWLLETVATAFRGHESESGTIEGKYFNAIVGEIRKRSPGSTLERILKWASDMHGYLSSPTGGGVRHGMDLKDGVELDRHEAQLFCDLTRSYIKFLLAEHQSISQRAGGA